MLACWVEDPNGESYKKHIARLADYIWVAEDGMKMQVCITISHNVSQVLISVSWLDVFCEPPKFWLWYFLFIYMQSFGSQVWDASMAIQALLAGNLNDELGSVLAKGHEFLKKSQVSVLECYDSLFLLFSFLSLWHQAQFSVGLNMHPLVMLQIRENPSGDYVAHFRHISKGGWAFSDQDHGWQVSDCTAEALKVIYNFFHVKN